MHPAAYEGGGRISYLPGASDFEVADLVLEVLLEDLPDGEQPLVLVYAGQGILDVDDHASVGRVGFQAEGHGRDVTWERARES